MTPTNCRQEDGLDEAAHAVTWPPVSQDAPAVFWRRIFFLMPLLLLALMGCQPESGQQEWRLDELWVTEKSCPVLDYVSIANALCSDGEIYVYQKRTGRYRHVQIYLAVY